jgi:hypothetical protein
MLLEEDRYSGYFGCDSITHSNVSFIQDVEHKSAISHKIMDSEE